MPVFKNHPTLQLKNVKQSIKARVPYKFVRDVKNKIQFGLAAPLSDEPIFIDPLSVKDKYMPGKLHNAPKFRRRHSGLVLGGDWDFSVEPLGISFIEASLRLRYLEDIPWRDTPLFQDYLAAIQAGGTKDGCKSEDDLVGRYTAMDRMVERVKSLGHYDTRDKTSEYFRREHGGIFVLMDRNGFALKTGGGHHRFVLSRILKLPEIPVQVGVIHKGAWSSGAYAALRTSKFQN